MNANNIYKTITLLLFGLLASLVLTPAMALTVAQKPLYIGVSKALPNIMLMVDNSGSMSRTVTTVAHTPNDMPADYSYTCNSTVFGGAATALDATTTVNMVVDSSGVPRFCTNSICSTSTAFSSSKCFDNKFYKVKYYHGTSLASDVYPGLNLNWYFKSGTFKKGSLLWGATTRTRMEIAKEAATNLVNSLIPDDSSSPTIRLGLTTFYGNTGGQIKSDMGTLTESYAEDINAQIATLTPTGYTPLGETLADIGRYFSDGGDAYTGNLTLHPGTTNQLLGLATIYNNGANNDGIKNSTDHGTLSVAVENYCQKNFAILLTDGLPTKDREISASLRDYSGDCATKNLCDSTPSGDDLDTFPTVPMLSTGSTCSTDATGTTGTDKYFLACQNGAKVGRKYENWGSDYLDDVAQALYEMDLRPDLIKPSAGYKNNLVTYTIGFADETLTEDLNGDGVLDNDLNGNGQLDNSLLKDAAIRGGGKFYFANNLGELTDSFNNILSDISSKVGSSSSVAANSTKLGSDTAIYQAKFDSTDWTGSFSALPLSKSEDINGNGLLDIGEDDPPNGNGNGKLDAGVIGDKAWDAADKILSAGFVSRKIFTYNPGNSPKGVLFECANLTDSQKARLSGSATLNCSNTASEDWRLNYLRGDFTHEARDALRKSTDPNPDPRPTTGGIFRNRTHYDKSTGFAMQPADPWLLGDIVNSDPVYVGSENYGYNKLPDTAPEKTTYTDFVKKNDSKINPTTARRKMVYIGSNDGLFHGFDANLTTADAGKEMLAYIPDAVYSQMKAFSAEGYVHQYSVDGSPRVADAYFGGEWHTVLASTTGAGGKAVFALDITNPDTFDGNDVLWEISDTTSPDDPDCTQANSDCKTDTSALRGFQHNMGYALPQPSVVRLNDGSWAAVVANGYGSANNLAVLYLVDIQTGHIIKAFDTAAGDMADHPNGLSTPIAVDYDGNRTTDAIYAGDLLGNLWKFDVSSTSVDAWGIAYGGSPLFVACSDPTSCNTTRQPITAKPQVGKVGVNQDKHGIMVYFGTGKYFEESDVNVANAQTQTLYGIWDNAATVARSGLQQQSILAELSAGKFNVRVTTDSTVDYPSEKGWYMDLSVPGSEGERSVSTPVMRGSKVVFTTLIPIPPTDTDTCGAGSDGTSWLMEMEAVTGSRIQDTGTGGPFDLNDDGKIDSEDRVKYNDVDVTVTGLEPDHGIFDSPTVVGVNNKVELKIINGTNQTTGPGTILETPSLSSSSGSGTGIRQSWQQLNID
ncbi:MAG: PilC/PilY family type IV pilus protein [Methylovulum sp.]|nr:PilC/PilY family type IV pilus protein [Methylovulum sp.]